MTQLPLPRLISLIAIAMAVVCGSKSAYAGVITQSSWGDTALVARADLPTDAPQRPTLNQARSGGLEGVPASSTSGSSAVALPASLAQLADASITGHVVVADQPLPEDPFLDSLPKPA